MTDPEYMDRAEALLRRIEACCDRINDETDADVDNQRVGGMVTLIFGNGTQIAAVAVLVAVSGEIGLLAWQARQRTAVGYQLSAASSQ